MKKLKTLGYIEVQGLAAAIVASDKMLKTADVHLKAVENSKGGGWITVNISGDVAAVSVAIDTARDSLGSAYIGSTVIANPAEGLDKLIKTDVLYEDTVKTSVVEKIEEPLEESIEKVAETQKPKAAATKKKKATKNHKK
ncbi:BMC domain-containing protein [Pediococcus claussenii]|uniref:BMC domain-containing protein n=1 Tax=Pediococcus claussenii TaxID=187452 RepID=UPI001E35FE16|nr:BMC domain-containing protein [Pediococcus claussenii]